MEARPARPRRVESRGSSILRETSVSCIPGGRVGEDENQDRSAAT